MSDTYLTYYARPHDAFPNRVGNATAGPGRTSRFTGKVLRTGTVGGTNPHPTSRAVETATNFEALVHNARKKLDAALLAVFRRIHAQSTFGSLVPS